MTSSYRWPFLLQQTAMERRRRREVMTARMMAMITVLKPPLLRLISSVRTSQRGLTYTWWYEDSWDSYGLPGK